MSLVMPPLWDQIHMDVPHSLNLINPILKFWEILDHIIKITKIILILLGTHRVLNPTKVVIQREILLEADNHLEVINNSTIKTMAISITGIRGVPSHMHGLIRGTTRGTCPLDTHPPHHSIVPFQRPLVGHYC